MELRMLLRASSVTCARSSEMTSKAIADNITKTVTVYCFHSSGMNFSQEVLSLKQKSPFFL